jgi:hypothetical protein
MRICERISAPGGFKGAFCNNVCNSRTLQMCSPYPTGANSGMIWSEGRRCGTRQSVLIISVPQFTLLSLPGTVPLLSLLAITQHDAGKGERSGMPARGRARRAAARYLEAATWAAEERTVALHQDSCLDESSTSGNHLFSVDRGADIISCHLFRWSKNRLFRFSGYNTTPSCRRRGRLLCQ